MIRYIGALAALAALSFSSVACTAPTEDGSPAAQVEGTDVDIVSRSAYFETFQGLDAGHYFNLMAGNGANILRSEAYTSRGAAEAGADALLANGSDARNFEQLEASNGDFYFNVKAGNGETIATSELYSTKEHAERGARTVRALIRLAKQEARAKTEAAPQRERFELFTGEDNQTYFRLRAANGEILLGSQAYGAATSAKKGIESVKANGASAASFQVFEAYAGGWAVSLVAANGEVIARGETYASKSNANRAVARMASILGGNVRIEE